MKTAPRARSRRTRLSLLAAVSALTLVLVGLITQTPASAAVTVNNFAGTGTAGFSGDGGAATGAQLNQPQGLVTDDVGNVYIFDSGNHRIREVSGGNISTMAGDGSSCSATYLSNIWSLDVSGICSSSYPVGFGGGPGGMILINNGGWLDEVYPGAKPHIAGNVTGSYNPGDGTDFGVSLAPTSLTGSKGGMYFAEAGTSGWPGNSIKLWVQGSGVSTVAGMSGTYSCNYYPYAFASPALTALGTCIHPQYLTLWSHYLYFFDASPGWQGPTIWRIDLSVSPSSRTLQHIAGSGSWSDYGSSGSAATGDGISSVGPIAVDNNGNLFFGSSTNGSIREVDTSGKLWNITDIGATQDSYAFDGSNNLYVSESGNNKVVEVTGLDPVTNKGNLVVLGDSVSAGEGVNYGFIWNPTTGAWLQSGPNNPSWTDTTASLGSNYQNCHQSSAAYPRFFSGPYTVYDMACTGASALQNPALNGGTTNGGVMVHENFSDSTTMLAELGSSTTPRCTGCDAANPMFDTNLGSSGTVLMLLGADDIDFADWIIRCYKTTNCGSSDQPTLNSMLSTEEGDLRTTITELNTRAGADGYSSGNKLHLVVTDYYNPYGSSFNSSCIDSGNAGSWPGIFSSQQAFITSGLASLNNNIHAEVLYAQANDPNLNVSLVDLSGQFSGLPDIMTGHTFCTADPWVYGPSIDYPNWKGVTPAVPNYAAPMHPTPEGQRAIYEAIVQQAGL